jgi:hypothetical protein
VVRFRGYRLVGESVVSVSDGAGIQQSVPGQDGYVIQGELGMITLSENRSDGGPSTARLTVYLYQQRHNTRTDNALVTTVNLADRQTIVLGTAGGTSRDSAIILTVTPTFQR